jgi:hypothetical protein
MSNRRSLVGETLENISILNSDNAGVLKLQISVVHLFNIHDARLTEKRASMTY